MRLADWVLAVLPYGIVGPRKMDALERILEDLEHDQREREVRIAAVEAVLRARVMRTHEHDFHAGHGAP